MLFLLMDAPMHLMVIISKFSFAYAARPAACDNGWNYKSRQPLAWEILSLKNSVFNFGDLGAKK